MSAATQRLQTKRQTLDEAYAPPANFLEIEVINPVTHGVGKMRYTDYEIRMRVSQFLFFFASFVILNICLYCTAPFFKKISVQSASLQTERIIGTSSI